MGTSRTCAREVLATEVFCVHSDLDLSMRTKPAAGFSRDQMENHPFGSRKLLFLLYSQLLSVAELRSDFAEAELVFRKY